jgi:hypothetical protein
LSQASVCVQPLPSSHAVPFAAIGFEHAPVAGSHVPATWHASEAAHVTALLPTQAPLSQASVCVQPLPSSHAVPFAAIGFEHAPVDGSQVPATWQASCAAHVTGLLPSQLPLWQVSVCVQASPSLHEVPFAAIGFEHTPVAGSHVPAAWHASEATHVTGLDPTHAPI